MAISQFPISPSRNMTNAAFVAAMDAFLAAFPNFVTEINAMGTALNLATTTTSSTSNSIGTGGKTFTVPAGLGYVPGMAVTVGATASGTNNMSGTVTSYSGTSLVLNITAINGSGAFSAWNIALSPAAAGASLGTNTFSGVQNFTAGTDIASAATINLTTATGNTVNVTGTTAISAVTLGNGQWRQVLFTGICQLTYNSTTHKLNTGGVNYTTSPGDSVFYFAIGGVVYGIITKADGSPVDNGMRFSGVVSYTVGGTASASDVGKVTYLNAATNQNLILPAVGGTSWPAGKILSYVNIIGAGTWTLQRPGTAVFFAMGKNNVNSIDITPQSSIQLTNDGTNIIQVLGSNLNLLGNKITGYSAGINYKADTDGFVIGRCFSSTSAMNLTVFSDSSPTPTYPLEECGTNTSSGNFWIPFLVPIKKGDYWRVTMGAGSAPTINFIPLGV